MMNPKEIKNLMETLSKRREDIFSRVSDLEEDLQTLKTMKEPETEEQAQDMNLARILALIDDTEKQQIEEIDWALRKIATGVYGSCELCNRDISYKRLLAVPATRWCKRCAAIQEKGHIPEEGTGKRTSSGILPSHRLRVKNSDHGARAF